MTHYLIIFYYLQVLHAKYNQTLKCFVYNTKINIALVHVHVYFTADGEKLNEIKNFCYE